MKEASESISINLDETIRAITTAIDLVGVDETHHGKRVACVASAIAKRLNWPLSRQVTSFRAAMLHDCGVSRTDERRELVSQFDWDGASEHCVRGQKYLRPIASLVGFADIIRWHHGHWARTAQFLDPELAETANLIFLADRIDVLRARHKRAGHPFTEKVIATLISARGSIFAPDLVEAAICVVQEEAFWFSLDDDSIEFSLDCFGHPRDVQPLKWAEMRDIGLLLARIIDAKSPFTADHSLRVAALSELLARLCGLPESRLREIEMAGLLHDIGKLRIPDGVLDKKGKLDESERTIMTRHPYDTWMLLKRLFGSHPIANWAAWHHETPLGTGYPFHIKGGDLPLESRIIAIADILQALLQERPYRAAIPVEEALEILSDLAKQNRVDRSLFELIVRNRDDCLAAAMGQTIASWNLRLAA